MQKNRQNIQRVAYKSRPKFNLEMGNIDFALQCPLWPQSENQKTIFGLDLEQHVDGPIKLIDVVGAVW